RGSCGQAISRIDNGGSYQIVVEIQSFTRGSTLLLRGARIRIGPPRDAGFTVSQDR
ncbi:MAG: hypothetical protein RL622_909, partial [Actinomycetota bacterium]